MNACQQCRCGNSCACSQSAGQHCRYGNCAHCAVFVQSYMHERIYHTVWGRCLFSCHQSPVRCLHNHKGMHANAITVVYYRASCPTSDVSTVVEFPWWNTVCGWPLVTHQYIIRFPFPDQVAHILDKRRARLITRKLEGWFNEKLLTLRMPHLRRVPQERKPLTNKVAIIISDNKGLECDYLHFPQF